MAKDKLLEEIQSQSLHQKTESHYAQAKAKAQRELKEKYESNAEVQRYRTQLTKEQKARDAIDRMIGPSKELLRMRTGREPSFDEARKYAENLAYKSDRDKK